MSPRPTLPGAAELFRATDGSRAATSDRDGDQGENAPARPSTRLPTSPSDDEPAGERRSPAPSRARSTGREAHEEKITVYCSVDELIELEHARLTLRREHRLAVDRGRIVREAIAIALADLEAQGASSTLVRRLLGR